MDGESAASPYQEIGTQPIIAGQSSALRTEDRVMIAIPLYKAAHLIPDLFRTLGGLATEIDAICGYVLLINDSPGDEELDIAMAEALPVLSERVPVERSTNFQNLGFVKTANSALRLAQHRGEDVILLNSDALPTPGALAEMRAVAESDPMIGFVSPRSNNATLCNSPYPEGFRDLDPQQALKAHKAIEALLPRVTYTPTAVGFCLYVRRLMIEEFGVFDEAFGGGYEEENDFILRCNRAGYRAALANRAFVHHLGGVSFAATDTPTARRKAANHQLILDRHPHYGAAVARYFSGVDFRTQWLLSGLVPDDRGRLKVLFDARNMGAYHNGTFEHTRGLLRAFVAGHAEEFAPYLACDPKIAAFHHLDEIDGLVTCDPDEAGPFAVIFRIAQPFELHQLVELGGLAPLMGFLFLDTIAMDCLDLDRQDYQRVWSWMTQTAALIGFNSRFTSDQFRRRFQLPPGLVDFVSLCSTDVREYAVPAAAPRRDHILVVGNHYPHKHVDATVELVRARTNLPLQVLGAGGEARHAGVTLHRAGELDQQMVDALYDDAAFVVFPSHYEGFGLPIMQALARGKPVIGRDLPPSREIKALCAEAVNLHLFSTTAAMIEAAVVGVSWRAPELSAIPQTWATAATDLRNGIRKALSGCDYQTVQARLLRLETLVPRPGVGLATTEASHERALAPVRGAPTMISVSALAARPTPVTRSQDRSAPPSHALDPTWSKTEALGWILEWADALDDSGPLTLQLSGRSDDAAHIAVLLIAAGMAPEAAEPDGDVVSIFAERFVDWSADAADALKDYGFLEAAYLSVLGRPGDLPGLQNYSRALTDGLSRRELLKTLYSSPERLSLAADLHGSDSLSS